MSNFVTFGKETINLENVTHITVDKRLDVPFIRFNFISEDAIRFSALTDYDEPNPVYDEVKDWLRNFQQKGGEPLL